MKMNTNGWWIGVSMIAAFLGCDTPEDGAHAGSVGSGGEGGGVSSLKVVLPLVAGICTLGTGCDVGNVDPGAEHWFTVAPGWDVPECNAIDGAPGLTMSLDLGESVVPTYGDIPHPEMEHSWHMLYPMTHGVVALRDQANTLFALQNNAIVISEDGGCSWHYHPASLKGNWYYVNGANGAQMHDAGGGVVYVHAYENQLLRVTKDTLEALDLKLDTNNNGKLYKWQSFRGMTSVPGDPDHLFAFTAQGAILESLNGGGSWEPTLGAYSTGESTNLNQSARAHFDPHDPSRILLSLGGVIRVSDNGGKAWVAGTFDTDNDGPLLLQSVVPSPTDFNVVWALGLQMAPGTPIADQIRMFRSTNGGRDFSLVGTGVDLPLSMGSTLQPVPQRPSEVLLVQETEIIRLNPVAKTSSVHPLAHPVSVATFSPADNDVLYLGFDAFSYWTSSF